jgi:pyruvate formate lyase activating enzyme
MHAATRQFPVERHLLRSQSSLLVVAPPGYTGLEIERDDVTRALTTRVRREFMREALLQERVNGRICCNACERRCRIVPGGLGWCRTRQHHLGHLVTLNYGAVSSLAVDPIEKKPFNHFHPGSRVLTAGGWSCNFGCPWCLNWAIASAPPPAEGRFISPRQFVNLAVRGGCDGIAASYNEPSLSLEWSSKVFMLAHRRDLYNTFVTNGYLTPEAFALLADAGLDAMNVDVKGDAQAVRRNCKGIDVNKVWATCKLARSRGLHLEITSLVIPGVNATADALRGIAARIASDLGPDVPWHVTGYYPAYKFAGPGTPLAALRLARDIGKAEGLDFVYIGNAAVPDGNDTRCPDCGALLIRRAGLQALNQIARNDMRGGRCSRCWRKVPGVWDN